MSNAVEQSYTEMKKKRILSILSSNLELSSIATCKVYTSGTQGKQWLFSDLDGLLCFLLDYQYKTRFLILFDSFSFEKLFQYELYNDFSKSFLKLSDDFRAFEVDNGFIGLQFDYASEANQFDIIIKKCEGNFLRSLFENKPFTKKQDTTEKMKTYAKALKELFCSGEDYDENYAEDGTEISKARSFEMLNNISYNKDTKQFEIGEISEELRKIFIAAGLRKKDLTSDLDFAFQMFKQIILGVSENKDLLYTDYFHKQYSPPESHVNKNESDDDNDNDNDDNDNENNTNGNTPTAIDVQRPNKQLCFSVKPGMNKQSNLSNSIKHFEPNLKSNANTNNNSNINNSKNNSLRQTTTPSAKPTLIQNKQIHATIQPLKQPVQLKETKPKMQVNQSQKPINSTVNIPKTSSFDFQPHQQVIPSSNKPKQTIPLSQPQKPVEQATLQQPFNNNSVSSKSSIPTPPQMTIPTPPQMTIPTPPQMTIPTPPQMTIPTPPQMTIPTPPQMTIPTPPQGQVPQPPPFNIPTPPPFILDLSMANIPIVTEDCTPQSREQELTSIKLKKVEVDEVVKAPSMYDQIKNVKLKAVVKKETAPIITKNENNYLQMSLTAAIQQRRKNIMKHQNDDDSEEEDW